MDARGDQLIQRIALMDGCDQVDDELYADHSFWVKPEWSMDGLRFTQEMAIVCKIASASMVAYTTGGDTWHLTFLITVDQRKEVEAGIRSMNAALDYQENRRAGTVRRK